MTKEKYIDNSVIKDLQDIGNQLGKPKYIQQLLDIFEKQYLTLVSEIKAGILKEDFEAVKNLAHKLKGSSNSIGAILLAENVQTLQTISSQPKPQKEELLKILDKTITTYQKTKECY